MEGKLLIIGAGDVGAFLAYNMNLFDHEFEKIGILDDREDKHGSSINGWEILGPVDDIEKYVGVGKKLCVAVGIAGPKTKKRVLDKLLEYDLIYPSFVSRQSWVSNGVRIGEGVIIYPGVSINHGTFVDDFSLINMNCAIGHDTVIGKYSFLSPGVSTGGFTSFDEGVQMGIGSATVQRVHVGEYAVVGGQCMLVRDVEPGATVVGVPGKSIK